MSRVANSLLGASLDFLSRNRFVVLDGRRGNVLARSRKELFMPIGPLRETGVHGLEAHYRRPLAPCRSVETRTLLSIPEAWFVTDLGRRQGSWGDKGGPFRFGRGKPFGLDFRVRPPP